MISSYDARGRRVGATVIAVAPNIVTSLKQTDKDGYEGVLLGLGEKRQGKKPQLGQLKKAGIDKSVRWLKEVRVKNSSLHSDKVVTKSQPQASLDDLSLGQKVSVAKVFKKGDVVKVVGTSKGKGFQGGVKRFGFSGGPKTHGQSDRHRAPGSIGSGTTPGRVFKGKHMAGHMGVSQVSYRGLEVISVDAKNNELVIKGAVPGAIGNLVMIENIGKLKGYTPPPEEKEDEEETAEASSGKVEATEEPAQVTEETAVSQEEKGEA